jgi:hypothetical protein
VQDEATIQVPKELARPGIPLSVAMTVGALRAQGATVFTGPCKRTLNGTAVNVERVPPARCADLERLGFHVERLSDARTPLFCYASWCSCGTRSTSMFGCGDVRLQPIGGYP